MLANLMLLLALLQAPTDAGAPAQDAGAAAPAAGAAAPAPMVSNIPTKVADSEGSFLFPPQASTIAERMDDSYMFTHWVSVFFTVLIAGWLIIFVVKYHRSRHPKAEVTATHNMGLELLWSVPPMLILGWIFWLGVTDYMNLRTPPTDAMEIQVTAKQWSWEFTYPNGASDPVLYVPVNRDVRLVMRSEDVLHSLFIPAFRTKMDVVPGRYTDQWFNANRTGDFAVFCTEYCGTQHSSMLSRCIVLEQDDWDAEMVNLATWEIGLTPEEVGARVYFKKGCNACHTVDGSAGTGPTFKGLWGKTESFTDGSTALVDENYVTTSILNPGAQIVAGYTNQMPTFQGRIKDEFIAGIIAYLKTLKD